jgi:hypothetical protein
MEVSIFEQVTSALTVKSICSPLGPDIPAGSTTDDLMTLECEADVDPLSHPSRVITADGTVKGIVWFEDYAQLEHLDREDDQPTIEQVMKPLEPNELLSSSTTILDAVEIFGGKPNRYFYVIDINEVVGVVFYRDLFKPLGRLAFLALALEIEDQALRLCQSAPINERCWLSISDNRRRKALELFKLRYKREPKLQGDEQGIVFLPRPPSDLSLLIGCTHLVDKATMIWKQKLIGPTTQADVLGFFNNPKEIRDQCAHPGGQEELVPKGRLAQFVNSTRRMRNSLRVSMESKLSRN